MPFDHDVYKKRFDEYAKEGLIVKSTQSFKIKLFLQKAESSLLIAKHHQEITPSKDEPPKIYWRYWAITISYYAMLYAAKAAILTKGYEVKDHHAAQVALGALFVPGKMEQEDLELLNQAHKIFEDEYVKYFEDARKESHTARYQARPSYTERQVDTIFENATKFIAKINLLLS
ncbi:TPA: HEPN domain-containing protein [Candidatus Woesearchaeota archaeon]|nr:HEPN domain-containing protein [Candidatus Woesearchaeota archaeon]